MDTPNSVEYSVQDSALLETAGLTHPALAEKLRGLPHKPGVYLMLDRKQRIIYVGKSSNLKNRVSSYFQSGTQISPRIRWMVSLVDNFETIVVDSEMEALLLENNLIKQHRPFFNVLLRDDKNYPMLEMSLSEPFPRLRLVRRARHPRNRYFGPYTSAKALHHVRKVVQKAFHLRTCTHKLDKPLKAPCLNYHIHLCDAPCTAKISQEEYREQVRGAIDFLEGRTAHVIKRLQEEMNREAECWNYERCAQLRDLIAYLEHIYSEQKVMLPQAVDEDYIAVAGDNFQSCAIVWQIRQGKLLGQHSFVLNSQLDSGLPDTYRAFILQFYDKGQRPPQRIIVGTLPSESEQIAQWLSDRRGRSVRLTSEQRGLRQRILHMALNNAQEHLRQELNSPSQPLVRRQALSDLREALGLTGYPWRMECYDISNTQGKQPVASMVVFEQGLPRRAHYRHFRIQGLDTPNDFAMMKQTLQRRFAHLFPDAKEEIQPLGTGKRWQRLRGKAAVSSESLETIPDLLIIDGGKGQLGVAVEVLEQYGLLGTVAVAGLAKQNEELYLPGQSFPVTLDTNSPAYLLVTHIRDEAHRFAITFHRQLRQKTIRSSALNEIKGLSETKKIDLLNAFQSLKKLQEASVEELRRVPGIGAILAQRIYSLLHHD
ncbi:MAG: excinuclease ABC subunit UvrC [bacterium]|nr:excinuclease ABC subunit UvrC [bacterium]